MLLTEMIILLIIITPAGGEVFCCSKCVYVFCEKCIVQNVSKKVFDAIADNDNWNCFACSPDPLLQLRAQHWALVNYMQKAKR